MNGVVKVANTTPKCAACYLNLIASSCSAFLICGQFGKMHWCFLWPLCVHLHGKHFPCHWRCQVDSTDMFVHVFPWVLKEQWVRETIKKCFAFFFPSCIWATEVAFSHLWPIHLELTLAAETFEGHKQCWELLGESLFVCASVFSSIVSSALDPLYAKCYEN